MTNKKNWLGILVLVFGVVLMGCATEIGRFTVATTNNVDLSRINEYNRYANPVKASDSTIYLLGFKIKQMELNRAMDRALSRIPGAVAMVDVRITQNNMSFIIGRSERFTVTGTALVDPRIITDGNFPINESPLLVTFSEEGEVIQVAEITHEEFSEYLDISVYIPQR